MYVLFPVESEVVASLRCAAVQQPTEYSGPLCAPLLLLALYCLMSTLQAVGTCLSQWIHNNLSLSALSSEVFEVFSRDVVLIFTFLVGDYTPTDDFNIE